MEPPLRAEPPVATGRLSLAQLPLGSSAVVESVLDGSPIAARLLDLGFVPGTRVRALRRSPLGDPVLFEVRGAQLCLRRSEASRILVRPLPRPGPA